MDFHLYPNPASDVVYLENTGDCCHVSLLNMVGQTVRMMKPEGLNKCELKMSDLDEGIYFIRFMDHKQNVCIKRVIKK